VEYVPVKTPIPFHFWLSLGIPTTDFRWRVSWMRWLTPQEENPWNFEGNISNTILETIEPWKWWLKSKGRSPWD